MPTNQSSGDARAAAEELERLLRGPAGAHLGYDDLAALADGTLPAGRRAAAEEHLDSCALCAGDAADLRATAAAMRPGRGALWLGAAAAAIAIVVAAGLWARARQPVAAIVDSGREIALLRNGELRGVDLPPPLRASVAKALGGGGIDVGHVIPPIVPSRATRGAAAAEPSFRVVAPFACNVVSDRPLLRWTPVAGASYSVDVVDSEFRPVEHVENLEATSWRPLRPLRRGATYAWQVTARAGGKELAAPAPPSPIAAFHVLDAATAEPIARLQASRPRSHLAVAIACAHAGAVDEAERELDALSVENGRSATAERLLHSLQH